MSGFSMKNLRRELCQLAACLVGAFVIACILWWLA